LQDATQIVDGLIELGIAAAQDRLVFYWCFLRCHVQTIPVETCPNHAAG